MKKVNINIDEEVFKEAEMLFNKLDLNIETAIYIFLKQSIKEGKIPFEINLDPNEETIAAILEADMMTANNTKVYETVADIFKELNND